MAKTTKRNPPDATLRNVKASNRRDQALERRVKKLEAQVSEAWSVRAKVKNLELLVNNLQLAQAAILERLPSLTSTAQPLSAPAKGLRQRTARGI